MNAQTPKTPPKNIVICLDGTGNEFKAELSNVVKLFRVLVRDHDRQVAYYHPGVGTLADPGLRTPLAKKLSVILGGAFGYGLTRNIEGAYAYLMEHFEEGDRIFIFGFSRGAYTARALAAFINECGLLDKGCQNLIPYAMNLFKQRAPAPTQRDDADAADVAATPEDSDELKARNAEFFRLRAMFKSTYARKFAKPNFKTSARDPNPFHYKVDIAFLGLWDTVKTYGWLWNPVIVRREQGENPRALTVRHALAIDEKRKLFQQMHWRPARFLGRRSGRTPAFKEVWFAGAHSDVGGGFPEAESGLAKITLEWMIEEAFAEGLLIETNLYRAIVLGKSAGAPEPGKTDGLRYVGPDPASEAHKSPDGAWAWVQWLPLPSWRTPSIRTIRPPAALGAQAEAITGASATPANTQPVVWVHESVLNRIAQTNYLPRNLVPPPYDSRNLPPDLRVEKTASNISRPCYE